MKIQTKLLLPMLAAVLIGSADDVSAAYPTTQPPEFLGSPASAQATVDKVVVITDKTSYVNVTSGSTVQFIVGGHSFTWCFENGSALIAPFDLRRIAPKGLLNHSVKTYVAKNPLYQS